MLAAGLGFFIAFSFILFQVPIATALGLVGFGGYAVLSGWTPALSMVATLTRESTLAYSLIVLPLFVLMGDLIAGAGISQDLFKAAQALIGRRRGGLAMATVLACGAFGAPCGSSVATAATMAKVTIPPMRSHGYADSLSAAAVAAGGTLGILIPPSIIMVIYGVATQTHIGMLYAAGMIPGAIATLGYMAAVKWSVWRNPSIAPVADKIEKRNAWQLTKALWPVVVIFLIVMGGLYGGLFTSIEAAGVGAAASMLFAIFKHDMTWRKIYEILVDTARTSTMMFAIILGAALFGEFINLTGVHEGLLALVQHNWLPPFCIVLIMIVIYLLLGSVLESLSMILLTVPIFFPVIKSLGYDPVWFGILIVMVVEVGLIHPPIGINLYVIRSMMPEIPMMSIVKGVIPFIVSDLLRILLIAAVPSIVMWLPNLLYKSAGG
ncbi:MAG: TRAP transporter large permease [Proteobacteria bacterium]|nr:TRAP transporter large permease [Pseudomonadota bacterium]